MSPWAWGCAMFSKSLPVSSPEATEAQLASAMLENSSSRANSPGWSTRADTASWSAPLPPKPPVEPRPARRRKVDDAETASEISAHGKTIAALRRDAQVPLELRFMTPRAVAIACSVSEQTVWRWSKRGLLTPIKLATTGDPERAPRRYRATEVLALIEKFAAGNKDTE